MSAYKDKSQKHEFCWILPLKNAIYQFDSNGNPIQKIKTQQPKEKK